MSYITVQEAAEKWGVSERLVRRYCAQNRIPGLVQYDGIWQIPEDAERPAPKTREPSEAPPLLKALIKQRDGKQYRGFYPQPVMFSYNQDYPPKPVQPETEFRIVGRVL